MKSMACAPQKAYKLVLGLMALAGGAVLFVLGITLLPVVGILLSLPTFAVAAHVFRRRVNDQCELSPT